MSVFCPNLNNQDVNFQCAVVGKANYTRALTVLKSYKSLAELPEYKSKIKDNTSESRKAAVLKSIVNHIIYIDQIQRINTINEFIKNNDLNTSAMLFNELNGYKAELNEGELYIHYNYGNTGCSYKYDSNLNRLVPFVGKKKRNNLLHKDLCLKYLMTKNPLYSPSNELELQRIFELDNNDLKSVLDEFREAYFLNSPINLQGHFDYLNNVSSDSNITSIEKSLNNPSSQLSRHFEKANNNLLSSEQEDIQNRYLAIKQLTEYNISQEHQSILVNYFVDQFNSYLSDFLNDIETFLECSTYFNSDDVRNKYREFAKNKNIKAAFTPELCASLFSQFRNEYLNYDPDGEYTGTTATKSYLRNDNTFLLLLKSASLMIKNTTGIGINFDDDLIQNKNEGVYESSTVNSPDEYDDTDTYISDVENTDDVGENDDSFAEFIAAHTKSFSINYARKNKDIILRAFGGILNIEALNNDTEYMHPRCYNASDIYDKLINYCHNCHSIDDMKTIISLIEDEWSGQVLERLNANNDLATKLFTCLRTQKRRYLGFYEGTDGKLNMSKTNQRSKKGKVREQMEGITDNNSAIHMPDGSFPIAPLGGNNTQFQFDHKDYNFKSNHEKLKILNKILSLIDFKKYQEDLLNKVLKTDKDSNKAVDIIKKLFTGTIGYAIKNSPVSKNISISTEEIKKVGLAEKSHIYEVWNKLSELLGLSVFGIPMMRSSKEFIDAVFSCNRNKYDKKTNTRYDSYKLKFTGIFSDLNSLLKNLSYGDSSANILPLYNKIYSTLVGETEEFSKVVKSVGDMYYAVGGHDSMSRMDTDLHTHISNTDTNRGAVSHFNTKQTDKRRDIIKSRIEQDSFLHSVVNLFGSNDFKNSIPDSMCWLVRAISDNPSSVPTLYTFQKQETKKFSQLNGFSHLIQGIIAMEGGVGSYSLNTHPMYVGIPFADKDRTVFWEDSQSSDIYNIQDCISFIKKIASAELQKIREVYHQALTNKDKSSKSEYYPTLTDDGKLDFSKPLNNCKFGFNAQFNKYLTTDPEQFKDSNEQKLATCIQNYIYSNDENNTSDNLNQFLKLIGDDTISFSIDNSLKAEANAFCKNLYSYYQQNQDLTFDVLEKMGVTPDDDTRTKIENGDKLTYEEFIYNMKSNGSNSVKAFRGVSLYTALRYYFANTAVAQINQHLLFTGDPAIYKNAIDITKRGAQSVASGDAYAYDAVDYNGQRYDNDRIPEYQGFHTSICISDVEGVQQTSENGDIANSLSSNKESALLVQLRDKRKERERDHILKQYKDKSEISNDFVDKLIKQKYKEIDNDFNIVTGDLCSTDGQSWLTPKALRRLSGQISESSPARDKFLTDLQNLFNFAAWQIREFVKSHPNDYNSSTQRKALKDLLKGLIVEGDGGFNEIASEYMKSDGYIQFEPIKQFISGFVPQSSINRQMLTQVKNSVVCPMNIAGLIEEGNFFLIRLISDAQIADIDSINTQSTVKNGQVNVFSTKDYSTPEQFLDNLEKILISNDKAAVQNINSDIQNTAKSYVYKHNIEDVVKQLEVPSHWGQKDTLGMQLVKKLPAYVVPEAEYQVQFLDSLKKHSKNGEQLITEFYNLLAQKYNISSNSLFKEFGIEKDSDLYVKLKNKIELTEVERKTLSETLSRKFLNDIQRTDVVSFQHLLEYYISYTGEGENSSLDFAIPLNEGLNTRLLSKFLSSAIKQHIIRQKVYGGQYVQATNTLKDAFIRASKNDKSILDDELRISEENINGVTHYYLEAIIPETYPGMLDKYKDENGYVDMSKVPEYMKHGVMYRIPTEGMCSIFHIKIKQFSSPLDGGTVRLPANLPNIAGIDFDIDKLFAFLAELTPKYNQDGSVSYEYETYHGDASNIDNLKTLSEQAVNNAFLERTLAIINSHFDSMLSPGNYEGVRSSGNRFALLLEYQDILKIHNIKPSEVFARDEDGNFIISDKQCKQLVKEGLDNINPITTTGRLTIIERNSVGTILKGIFADANTIASFLAMKNIAYTVPTYISKGVSLNGINVINSSGSEQTYCPNYDYKQFSQITEYLRQLLAASLDGAKDPVLLAAGVTEFTAPILIQLLLSGFDLEHALAIVAQPYVRYLDKRNQMDKALDPTEYTEVSQYLENKSYNEPVNITDEMLYDSSIISKDFENLTEGQKESQINMLTPLLRLASELTSEMFSLKELIKRDTSNDKSNTDLFGMISRTSANEYYLEKNANGETLLTDSVSKMFDKESPTYTPHLVAITDTINDFIEDVLFPFNPQLGSHLKSLISEWMKNTGKKLKPQEAQWMYQQYMMYRMMTSNKLSSYFQTYKNSTDLIDEVYNNSISLYNQRTQLLQIPELSDNKFLLYLSLFDPKTSESAIIAEDFYKNSGLRFKYLGINTQNLPDTLILQIEDDLSKLVEFGKNDKTVKKYIDDIFALSFVRNSFSTVTDRSLLRFMTGAVKLSLFDKNYIKFFRDDFNKESDGSAINTNNLRKDTDFLIMFARHNPHLLKHQKFASSYEWRRTGTAKKGNLTVLLPTGMERDYVPYSKLGVPGIASEYFHNNKNSLIQLNNIGINKTKMNSNGIVRVAATKIGDAIDYTAEDYEKQIQSDNTISIKLSDDLLIIKPIEKELHPSYTQKFSYKGHEYNSIIQAYEINKNGFNQYDYENRKKHTKFTKDDLSSADKLLKMTNILETILEQKPELLKALQNKKPNFVFSDSRIGEKEVWSDPGALTPDYEGLYTKAIQKAIDEANPLLNVTINSNNNSQTFC